MNNVFQMSRKALTMGVVLTTILWSMMAAVLVAPMKASAAGCTSGSLIKGSLAAVYYCGADGKRYVFPNEKTYFTWYADFSGVMLISDADLANIQIGGNVTYRPGVKLVKIQSDPKVYAVAKGGVLRHVTSEALAIALYGADWNTADTHDVSDAFFTNYTVGASINSASDYNPTAEMSGSQSINQDKNLTGGTSTSGLSVSKASDSPASATIPLGAQGVNFLKFVVSNGTGSTTTVDGVTLHRVGAGAPTDFTAVYLYEGDRRLTTGRTVNTSSNEVLFNGLGLVLTAGQSRTLWVSASMSATGGAGNVNAFEVTSVSTGSAQAIGLPIVGSNMTNAGALVGLVTVNKTGSLTNPKLGALKAKIGEFQLAAGTQEDIEIKRVTLFQGGSISRSNLSNLKLTQAGSEVAAASGVDEKDRMTFVFTGTNLLEKGSTRTYEVWADISAGARTAETVILYMEEDADLLAIGKTYGYGVRVNRNPGDTPAGSYDGSDGADGNTSACATSADTTDNCSVTALEGGQITINFNGPAGGDVATNGKDKEVMNFTISAQANVEVRNLRMSLNSVAAGADTTADANDLVDTTGPTANYTDIKVTDTASGIVLGPLELVANETGNNDITQNLVFTDVFTLNAGQSRTFKVTLDVRNNAALAGDKIRMDLQAFQGNDIRNLENSTYVAVADIVPSSTIGGNDMTVKVPTVEVSAASTPVVQTYIKGSQNVELGGFNLKAGDGSDIKVTSLTVTGFVDAFQNNGVAGDQTGDTAGFQQGQDTDADSDVGGPNVAETKKVSDIVLTAKLMNGTTQVGELKSPTTSTADGNGGQFQFTGLNLSIPKGSTVNLKVVANLSNSTALLPDRLRMDIVATGDMTSQDPEGNDVLETAAGGGAFAQTGGSIMTIASAGTLTVIKAPDDTESEAGIVVGAASNVVLGKLRFTAANEELKVTKLRLNMTATSTAGVSSITLWDGATQVGGPSSPVAATGNTDFSNVNFVVPKDGSKTLTVKATLSSVGAGGAATGLNLMQTLKDGFGASHFEARGTSSSTTITDYNTVGSAQDIAMNEKILRKTKVTVSNAALSSLTLLPGSNVASRFTVTADAAGQASVKSVVFNIAKSDNAMGVAFLSVREVGVGTDIPATATANAGCPAAGVSPCTLEVTFTNEQTISAGTSKTYELRVDVTVLNGARSISTTLLSDTAAVTGELGLLVASGDAIDDLDGAPDAANQKFIWSDNSAIPHNDTAGATLGTDEATPSNDWTNGRFVKVLPNDAQTLSE